MRNMRGKDKPAGQPKPQRFLQPSPPKRDGVVRSAAFSVYRAPAHMPLTWTNAPIASERRSEPARACAGRTLVTNPASPGGQGGKESGTRPGAVGRGERVTSGPVWPNPWQRSGSWRM
jgi:hypothetical protein